MAQNPDVSRDQASREVVAEAMTDILPQSTFVRELAQKHKSIFEKLHEKLKAFVKELRGYFASIGSNQAPEARAVKENIDGALRYAEEVVKMFDRIAVQAVEHYQTAERSEKDTDHKAGEVQMQIRQIGNSGKFYVQAERQVLTGTDPDQWGKQIEKYINESIRQEQDVAIPTQDGHVLLLTARSAYKLKDRHIASIQKKIEALLTDEEYSLKGRAATHIDELIQVARFDKYESDLGQKHQNDIGEDGFNYFEAYFRDFDGKYYRIVFSAGINEAEETVYSIGRVRQRSFPADRGSSSKKEALKGGRKASKDIIYTSEDKSQAVKSAIQLAYEKALAKANSNSKSQNQRRTSTLTNRDILARASRVVDKQSLTEGQRSALQVFTTRLQELEALEKQKRQQRSILKMQQTNGVDATEIRKTQNRIQTLNSKINRKSQELLSLEDKTVLKRVLEQARTVIEDEQAAERRKAVDRYRESRKDSAEKAAMRKKIRKVIRDLNKLFTHGDKKRNVKEGIWRVW